MTRFAEILHNEFSLRSQRNPAYSVRAFARTLQVSPGTLSLIFSGQMVPSVKLTTKLLDRLDLSQDAKQEFLDSLSKTHASRNLRRKNRFLSSTFLEDLSRRPQERKLQVDFLEQDQFQIISDWYHYAIMMLAESEGAKLDEQSISERFGITPLTARFAVSRLKSLGLLKEQKGKLIVDHEYMVTADRSKTTPSLRRHQRQILEKAIHSLEVDPIEKRSHTSLTMSIDPARLPKAKEMIETFNQKLCAFLEGGNRTKVYQLGVSLFPLEIEN